MRTLVYDIKPALSKQNKISHKQVIMKETVQLLYPKGKGYIVPDFPHLC